MHSLVWCGSFLCRLEKPSLVGMVPLWARSVKRCGRQPTYVSFGWFGRKEIGLHSKMRSFRFKGWKNSFVCSYWSWTKLFIDKRPISLIDFFYWLGTRWGWVCFLYPLFFLVYALRCLLYTPCMLWVDFWVPFTLYI